MNPPRNATTMLKLDSASGTAQMLAIVMTPQLIVSNVKSEQQ